MEAVTVDIREWGEWINESFQSGTVVVSLLGKHQSLFMPNIYVHGDKGQGEKDYQNQRYRMARSLVSYLNGGEKPSWLDGFVRKNEVEIEGPNGARIIASGPLYDASPPALDWKQVDTDEARKYRFVVTEFFLQ